MSNRIEEEAADWVARRNGHLTPSEQEEFDTWIARDVRHAHAFAAMERTWVQLNAPRQCGQANRVWGEIENLRCRRTQKRMRTWSAIGLAASVALISAVYFSPSPISPMAPLPATITPRPVIRTLVDGSKIALKPGASIEVEIGPRFRRVHLIQGEALFSVVPDAARPFVVRSGGVEVRAVGTEFSVAQGADALTVLVTEGRIAVARTESEPLPGGVPVAPPVFAGAGDRVMVSAGSGARDPVAVTTMPPGEIAQALAWRGERVEFSDTPLPEAIRRINRGRAIQVVLASAELERRTITGVLWADDGDGFVRLLESGFNLTAEREGPVVRLRVRP